MKVYFTNRLGDTKNERCIEKVRLELGRGVISIYEKNSTRDIETQTLSVDISDNQIHTTGNILGKLKMCIGGRVMLTANINTSDHLINESTWKTEYMQMLRAGNNLVADVDADNSLKNNLLRNELKECVPITVITKTFPYSHMNKTVTAHRKQIPLKLERAITMHSY